jgi:hypothetical protein
MYWLHTLPRHVVVEDDGLWLVPIIPGGWSQRRPYRGHTQALHPFETEPCARMLAMIVGQGAEPAHVLH